MRWPPQLTEMRFASDSARMSDYHLPQNPPHHISPAMAFHFGIFIIIIMIIMIIRIIMLFSGGVKRFCLVTPTIKLLANMKSILLKLVEFVLLSPTLFPVVRILKIPGMC